MPLRSHTCKNCGYTIQAIDAPSVTVYHPCRQPGSQTLVLRVLKPGEVVARR